MAETIISTLLVGFILVSTLDIVGPMVRSTSVHADRLIAANLANELTEEIATKLWTTPLFATPDSIGPETGEIRSTFDDIDDYDGWSASPPKMSSNQANVNLGGWTRSVSVIHVELVDASTKSPTSTGLKRVTVTITKNGIKLARIESLHSQSADSMKFIVP